MNWRDYTSIFAIAVVAVGVITLLLGLPALQLDDWRLATGLLAFLGLGIYIIMEPQFTPRESGVYTAGVLLGVLSILITVPGIVFSNELLFFALAIDLIVLWTIVTISHITYHPSKLHRHVKQ